MKVAVSLSIGTMELKPQVEEILRVLQSCETAGFVVLVGHKVLDPEGSRRAEKTADEFPGQVFTALAGDGSWSAGYLKGMQTAVELAADSVISMDADGSHDPTEIPKFIDALNWYPAVMSSRFLHGAVNKYPLQRKVISFIGTLLSRSLLTSRKLTDFTSGFEAVQTTTLRKLFERYPPKKWVSVRIGPYHLQNTELRLALIDLGCEIVEIPIRYGVRRKGKTFDLKFMFKVFKGFLALVLNRRYMRKVLRG